MRFFKVNYLYGLFLLTISIPLITLTGLQAWGDWYDDAFITYRYADNLSNGGGLVWNLGEAPTEGFTSILHVLVLVPLMQVGMDGLEAARWINAAFLLATAFFLYRASIRFTPAGKASALTVSILFLLLPSSVLLVMVGLETPIYTFFLLIAVIYSAKVLNSSATGTWTQPSILALIWFLLILTRPEGGLAILATWCVVLLCKWKRKETSLRQITRGTLIFVSLVGVYIVWKLNYFGNLLPNPFYIKSSGLGPSPLGINSILTFLDLYAGIIAIALATVALVFGKRTNAFLGGSPINRFLIKISITTFILNALFYIRTDTLMDIHGRFLYPMLPLVILVAAPLITLGSENLLQLRNRMIPVSFASLGTALLVLSGANLGSLLSAYSFTTFSESIAGEKLDIENNVQLNLAQTLSDYPLITRTKIAYGDAGVIPYLTRSLWVDPVGLNDTFLARSKDITESANYFFDQEPDLVLIPVNNENEPIEFGHGLLGNYAAWANESRWSEYQTVGTIQRTDTPYSLEVRVRNNTPLTTSLTDFIRQRILSAQN